MCLSNLLVIRILFFLCDGTVHVPSWKKIVQVGVFKLSCVHTKIQRPHLTPPRLSGRKTSLQATVVSMVTGRVEVREEVVRTGCSEAMREAVGDAYRSSSSPPRPHTPKTVSGVFCELLVCRFLPSNRPSVLPSFSSGGGVRCSSRYLCDSLLSNMSLIPCSLSLSLSHTLIYCIYIQYPHAQRTH